MSRAQQQGNSLIYKGSAYLKQRLVLSTLSGKPVRITDIRTGGDTVGLMEYEISLIRLLDKLTNGTRIELDQTGTSIYFQPGLLYGGHIEHDCNPERGIGYYLEVLCMLGFFCKQPIKAVLRGVTNCNMDPGVDIIKNSMLSVMRKFVIDDEGLDMKITKRGLQPQGGGEVLFTCPIRKQLRPVQAQVWGKVKRVRGVAYSLRVSPATANRMVDSAKRVLLQFIPDVYITTDHRKGKQAGLSPGFGIYLSAETTKGVFFSSEQISSDVSSGEEPSVPEDIGQAGAQRLLHEIFLGGAVESSCQALALLFMALGPRDVSTLITGSLSDYAVELLRHLREFMGVTFKVQEHVADDDSVASPSAKVQLTCVGTGYVNVSRRQL